MPQCDEELKLNVGRTDASSVNLQVQRIVQAI